MYPSHRQSNVKTVPKSKICSFIFFFATIWKPLEINLRSPGGSLLLGGEPMLQAPHISIWFLFGGYAVIIKSLSMHPHQNSRCSVNKNVNAPHVLWLLRFTIQLVHRKGKEQTVGSDKKQAIMMYRITFKCPITGLSTSRHNLSRVNRI